MSPSAGAMPAALCAAVGARQSLQNIDWLNRNPISKDGSRLQLLPLVRMLVN